MREILLIYSTVDGHTFKVTQTIADALQKAGCKITISDISDAKNLPLADFDMIVIGAAIRYGKHRPTVAQFVQAHRALLEEKPNAFFSVNLIARKIEKQTPDGNPYVRKFLKQTGWQPKLIAIFAGKLNYPQYPWFDRMMIRFIMKMTGGPTDPSTVQEFTDWDKVAAFAEQIASHGKR